MRNRSLWRLVLVMTAVLSLVAAACGDDDDDDVEAGDEGTTTVADDTEDDESSDTTEAAEDGAEGESDGAAAADLKACEVTDEGGVDDRSFNQIAYAGLQRAESELGVETALAESDSPADYGPNIEAHLGADCDLIITVGFALGDATAAAAAENPDVNFAIVDFAYEEPIDNVLGLTFATDQAAYLAGYVAAGMTETGTIGTYGGANFPTVTIFMEGFRLGMEQYNEDNGAEVELVGWDGSDGLFTGDFTDQSKGRQTTESLLDQGADIIMPVAGPVGLGTLEALKADSGGNAKAIWVDTDGCESVPDDCQYFLTSVQKQMDNAVFDVVESAVNGEFEGGGVYTGTLENEGVTIAPYNEFEDEVPQELKDRVDELREQIISGELTVGG
ncbi:MAG: BMP family ABC transporter substrate-binding protein [Actinomycetota bacterium]|nr:BMP family ABC transporter substrate-binding protein [Actinomycetota bacterium]